MPKHVGFGENEPLVETNVYSYYSSNDDDDDDDNTSTQAFQKLKGESFSDRDQESMDAEQLSMRLLSVPDDDEEQQDRILRESLHLVALSQEQSEDLRRKSIRVERHARGRFWGMVVMGVAGLGLLGAAFYAGAKVVGPPRQPIGPYKLIERQVRTSISCCVD